MISSKLVPALAAAITGVVLASPPPAEACSDASQALRFPLGLSSDGLAVLRLELHRSDVVEKSGDFAVRWQGTARVELLAGDGRARLHADLGAVDVADGNYSAEVAPIFRRAQQAAASLAGFVPAKTPRYRACGLRTRCGKVRVKVQAGQLQVIAGGEQVPVSKQAADRLAGDSDPGDRSEALGQVRIVHTFQVRIGKVEYWVVNLAAGGERHAWPELRSWPPRGCASLAACPPHTMTLHHGAHVDVIVP